MSDTRTVETSGADIEEAIELGLEQLGVSRESVVVEVLEEPSRGLLGIGARRARVRLSTAAPPRSAKPEKPAPPPAAQLARRPARSEPREQPAEDITPVSEADMDDDAKVGLATLQELLDKMHITADVLVYQAEPAEGEETPWVLQIRGNDLGMLIGRRGETLSALQYITRLIASRELQRRANIVLDVEGYKARREQMLRRLAARMADQAIQLGRTVSLEPMSPYERRIVHLALRDHPDVITQSVGEGNHRKVTIVPNSR
ncbi:MAG: Jag N-terminal domain-containing protein [Anaerolineae bacterium]|nr:Jag N-terminal domain-containing protein [Anaerolineae bacterium]